MVIEDYKRITIALLRTTDARLNKFSDERIAKLYENYCRLSFAHWLGFTERGAAAFVEWVFSSPAEQMEKETCDE